jgi:hypothetical protein
MHVTTGEVFIDFPKLCFPDLKRTAALRWPVHLVGPVSPDAVNPHHPSLVGSRPNPNTKLILRRERRHRACNVPQHVCLMQGRAASNPHGGLASPFPMSSVLCVTVSFTLDGGRVLKRGLDFLISPALVNAHFPRWAGPRTNPAWPYYFYES